MVSSLSLSRPFPDGNNIVCGWKPFRDQPLNTYVLIHLYTRIHTTTYANTNTSACSTYITRCVVRYVKINRRSCFATRFPISSIAKLAYPLTLRPLIYITVTEYKCGGSGGGNVVVLYICGVRCITVADAQQKFLIDSGKNWLHLGS